MKKTGPMPPHQKAINAMLEPELRKSAAHWPAARRLYMARKFHRWANQLAATALILSPVEDLSYGGRVICN